MKGIMYGKKEGFWGSERWSFENTVSEFIWIEWGNPWKTSATKISNMPIIKFNERLYSSIPEPYSMNVPNTKNETSHMPFQGQLFISNCMLLCIINMIGYKEFFALKKKLYFFHAQKSCKEVMCYDHLHYQQLMWDKFLHSPWRWRQRQHLKNMSLLLTPLTGQDNFTSVLF